MKEADPNPTRTVPPDSYTHDYFTHHCQGYEEFASTQGLVLPLRLRIPLEVAAVGPGMQVVDVGCGRGELVLHCARRGARAWGLDYAEQAVRLARDNIATAADVEVQANVAILRGTAQRLPLGDACADLVFMLDIVEHLLPDELADTLDDVQRVLRAGGRLVVHTMPNLWYYRFGYPLYRVVERLRGRRLPADPRDRWAYRHVHVNEQDPVRLHRLLGAHGFKTRVWLTTTQTYEYERNPILRWGMQVLTHVYPFRWIFCDDILALGIKR